MIRTLRIAILAVLLTSLAEVSAAAPVVTGVQGTLTHRATVTITGSQFGVKNPAPPLKYDDFTSGTVGQALPAGTPASGWTDGWHVYSHVTGYLPRYDRFATGRVDDAVAHQEYRNGNYNATIGLYDLDFRELYISGWTYADPQGPPSENAKLINFGGDSNGDGSTYGYPQCRTDQYPFDGSGHLYFAFSNNTYVQDWGMRGDLYPRQWNRIERYLDNGTTTTDGSSWVRRNLGDWAGVTGRILGDGKDGPFRKFFIGHYYRLPDGGSMDRYWDELYVDITLARVELGNASTWSACTRREIQIPVTWNDGQITVRVNQGGFTANQNVYMFVVDRQGVPSAQGLPVVFGGSITLGPPGAPGQPLLID